MDTASSLGPKQARLMLVVLFAAAFVATYNENIMNMALVSLMADLSVDAVTSQWLVSGYMVVSTLMVVTTSFLFQRFKIRPLFFSATAILAAASVLGAFAPSFPLLLTSRLLQAVGAGMLIPLMMNSIILVAPHGKLGSYMAVGSCMITFGPALAPVLSGLLVTLCGWRFVFAPVALITLVVLLAGIPLVRNANSTQAISVDPLSIALAAVGLFAFVYGVSILSTNLPFALGAIAAGVAGLAAFVVRQLALKKAGREPLLDMAPMRSGRFFPACILVMIVMTCNFSMSVLLPLYFEEGMGLTSMMAGLLLLVPVLSNAIVALFAGRIEDSQGEWPLLPIGFALACAGMALNTISGSALSVVGVFVGTILVFCGTGAVMSPSQTAGLKTLPRELNPSGVSLLNVFIQVAACIAPSLFIGLMSGTQEALIANGTDASAAAGAGFAQAALIAAVIAGVGVVLALGYAWMMRGLRRGGSGAR